MKKISLNSLLAIAFVIAMGSFNTACSSSKDQVKPDQTLGSRMDSSKHRTVADSSNLGASSSGRGN